MSLFFPSSFIVVVSACVVFELNPSGVRRSIVGGIGSSMLIILFISPFQVAKIVFKEKSTRSLPFFTSCASFVHSISWFHLGLTIHDPLVYVPNAIGALSGALQLLLFFYFGVYEVGSAVNASRSSLSLVLKGGAPHLRNASGARASEERIAVEMRALPLGGGSEVAPAAELGNLDWDREIARGSILSM